MQGIQRPVAIDLGMFAQTQGLCAAIWAQGSDAKLEEIQELLIDLNDQAQNIQTRADTEKRDLLEDERKEIDSILAQAEKAENDLERRKRILAHKDRLSQPTGRKTTPEGPTEEEIEIRAAAGERPRKTAVYEFPREEKGKGGFRSQSEFFGAVLRAGLPGGQIDPRLIRGATPTTYQQEGVGADGGFAVPPDFRLGIMQKIENPTGLFARTDRQQTTSNNLVVALDQTTPWQTSGAVRAYWEGEAAQFTQSKSQLTPHSTRLHKIYAFVPVTEEQLEDVAATSMWITSKAPAAIDFALTLAIVQGDGVGKPLGMLNSACMVTVAKESSQAADTVVAQNISKMWARLWGPSRMNAIWLVSQSIEDQLDKMFLPATNVAGSENVGGWPVYLPPNGFSQSPFATLKGRPVIPTEACNDLGDKGDIILVDMMQYLTVTKMASELRQDVSIHILFDYDMSVFRFILRVGGQPWLTQPITSRSGNYTYSPMVTLAERA